MLLGPTFMFWRKALLLLLLLATSWLRAQPFLPLWPTRAMPNSRGMTLTHEEARQRITQVKTPGMYVFLPAQEDANGAGVLVLPSGGYQKLTYNLGGFQLAKWLNTHGYAAFVLLYRLPTSPDLVNPKLGPIQDAQRAMKLIRSQAETWHLDTARLGVMGASAGGHLAAHLSTAREDYAQIGDDLDALSVRPAFQILISPVISMGAFTHQGSKRNLLGAAPADQWINAYSMEHQVKADTPPALLIHAHDDQAVSPQNSLLYYQALHEAGVSASLHIFPQGGHAIGVTGNPGSTRWWTEICAAWLAEMGLHSPASERRH